MANKKNSPPGSLAVTSSLRNPWIVGTAIFLLLAILTLIAIPYAISYGARQWLLENGGDRVQVEDVDFNPFTATLGLQNLQVQVNEETTLNIGTAGLTLAWSPLFKRQAHVRDILLDDFSITVERDAAGKFRIGGVIPPQPEEQLQEVEASVPWQFGIDSVTLSNCSIEYREPRLQARVTINKLALGELANWTPEKAATLHLDGAINGATVLLDGEILPFAARPGGSGHLKLSGLPLGMFASLAEPALSTLEGTISIDSKLGSEYDENSRIHLKQDGSISVDTLKIATASEKISNSGIAWDGTLSAAAATDTGNVEIQSKGTLGLDKLIVAFPQRDDLVIRNDTLAWNGDFSFSNIGEMALEVLGSLEAREFHATAEEHKINLIDMQSLAAGEIAVKTLNDIAISQIDIRELTLAGESEGESGAGGSLNHIPVLGVTDLQYSSESGLSIGTITESDVRAVISRDESGEWNAVRLVDILAKLGGTDGETGEKTESEAETGTAKAARTQPGTPEAKAGVRIDRWIVTGNNALVFRDRTATPPFETTLNISKLEGSDIDSNNPDKPSPITVEGSIGKHTAVNMSGTLSPFAEPVAYDLKGTIEALELPPLSSYTVSTMGFELDSGQLDADFSVKASGGKLEGNTDLTIRQLDLGSVDDKRMAEMESNLSVPLDVALGMLRDDNDVIHLEVPFSGSPDSPDFDISDAVNQALASALKQGSMTYLTMALQPYGTLITVAKYAGEQATKVRLNPIEFAPGSPELDAADFDYLGKVASILNERPKISIKICGAAVQADRTALASRQAATSTGTKDGKQPAEPASLADEQLVKLAQQRDDAVKDYLIDKHGISAKRLVACEANLDMKKADAKPRVDLLI